MQAWHCVAIIAVSILLFIYGTFRNEVEDRVYEQEAVQVVTKAQESLKGEDISTVKPELLDSPAWAKYEIMLKCVNSEQAQLHLQAIKGASFLQFFLSQVRNSKTASELIFSPFKSEFFSEDEYSILQSLFSAHTTLDEDTVLRITCRGHSAKSTKLLATLILDSYKIARQREDISNPLVSSLLLMYDEVQTLKAQISSLKDEISAEDQTGTSINVEDIALRSELKMLEQELAHYKKILLEIDKLFKAGKPTKEYLSIESITQFGMIEELRNTMDQLQMMLVNQELDSTVTQEVKKNIETNRLLVKNEVANAIEELKAKTIMTLERKKILSARLVDLQKKEGLNLGGQPKFTLLKQLEDKHQGLLAQYQKSFTDWQQSNYDIIRSSFVE